MPWKMRNVRWYWSPGRSKRSLKLLLKCPISFRCFRFHYFQAKLLWLVQHILFCQARWVSWKPVHISFAFLFCLAATIWLAILCITIVMCRKESEILLIPPRFFYFFHQYKSTSSDFCNQLIQYFYNVLEVPFILKLLYK